MKLSQQSLFAVAAISLVLPQIAGAQASWDPFIIRTVPGATTPVLPVESVSGQGITVNIDESGEKAGYGTSFFDGQTLSHVPGVAYSRVDPGLPDPYVNIWVSDGSHYAVIAPVTNMAPGGGYTSNDVNGLDMQSLGFNIYETDFTNLNWVYPGSQRVAQGLMKSDGSPVHVGDIGNLLVSDPGVYPSPPIGTGAPKHGTGFNLVFGDTQGNFLSPVPYTLEAVQVPEPTGLAAMGLVIAGVANRRRRSA